MAKYFLSLATIILLMSLSVAVWLTYPLICDTRQLIHNARPGVEVTSAAIAQMMDCKTNHACLSSQILATTGAAKKSAAESIKTSEAARKSAEQVSSMLFEVHPQVVAISHNIEGMSLELLNTMRTAHASAAELQVGLGPLLTSTNEAVVQLTGSLSAVERLTDSVREQVESGGPVSVELLSSLSAAVNDFDKILASEDITSTLNSMAKGSSSLAEVGETLDQATRAWRKKAGQLKLLVTKALGLIKLTVSPF